MIIIARRFREVAATRACQYDKWHLVFPPQTNDWRMLTACCGRTMMKGLDDIEHYSAAQKADVETKYDGLLREPLYSLPEA